jgi:hypothetical protein
MTVHIDKIKDIVPNIDKLLLKNCQFDSKKREYKDKKIIVIKKYMYNNVAGVSYIYNIKLNDGFIFKTEVFKSFYIQDSHQVVINKFIGGDWVYYLESLIENIK